MSGKIYVDGALRLTWQQFAHGDSWDELKESLTAFVENVILAPYGEYDYVLEWFHESAEELGRFGVMQDYEVKEFVDWSWDLFDKYGFIEND